MNIRYIQSNISQVPQDNLIKFLYDLVLQEVENVKNYQSGIKYYKGDKVYLQENGKHQIFQCIVDESSSVFINDEWTYIMEIFEGEVEKYSNLKIKEEVHIIDENNKNKIQTSLEFESSQSTVALYCGKKRYAINHDFVINDNIITFTKPFNIGDRVILEVRETIGTIPILVGVVLYDLNKIPYKVYIDNNRIINIEKLDNYNTRDIKYGELVTGDKTYTLLVDGGSKPYELKAYRKIETYITGTNNEIYKVDVIDEQLKLTELDRGDVFSDTKIILGLDRKFYTLSIVDGVIVATEYIDNTLDVNNFDLGIKVISSEFKNRLICIDDGKITIMPYIDNGGYHNINFKDLKTGGIIRLCVNNERSLEMYDDLDTEGYSGTRILDYFYFFDNEWYPNRMYVEDGKLLFEDCEMDVIPDSRGINILKKDGEMVKLKIPHQGEGIHMITCISLTNMGTFESPIEGFVVEVDNEVKLVTINKYGDGFELVDTNLPFRTNHHYVLSKDNKLYKLVIYQNSIGFVEVINEEYNRNLVIIDAGNNNYYYLDSLDGDIIARKTNENISNEKICTLVISYKGERFRFMEVDNDLTFVKVTEEFDNESPYVCCMNNQSKMCYFKLNEETLYYREIDNYINNIVCEYDIECMTIGAFFKSNEMITRFDIVDGECVFNPISTFKHRIKSTDGKEYYIDIKGEPNNEQLIVQETPFDEFETEVGFGNLYLRDINGNYLAGNINNQGEFEFKNIEPIEDVDYEITSLISTSQGLYKLISDNGIIKFEKMFDNMFEDMISYGNIIKKSFEIPTTDGKYYAVSANGLGEIIIEPVDEIIDATGLLLRSNDGYNYGVGILGNRFVTYRSYITNPYVKDYLCVKDMNNNKIHKLFMDGNRLCSDITNESITNMSLIMYDPYQNAYKIEMQNDILIVTSL